MREKKQAMNGSRIKGIIKSIIKKIPIAFTKNQMYDRQTKRVIKRVCKAGSDCIDIGAHKGEVLDIMIKYAPKGRFFAFEPIPVLYEHLKKKYAHKVNCTVMDFALSDKKGVSSFNYVVSNPSYSGLIKRKYDRSSEIDTTISVKTELLDNIIPPDFTPDLIKIDVEGGELYVMEGARELIARSKPVIIFEYGLGASDYYGATPEKVFRFFATKKMNIYTLKSWLNGKESLTEEQFSACYFQRTEYYFLACSAPD